MTHLEVAQYLDRIKLSDCHPTLAGLAQLQEHHMEHIPFENLDIVVGRKIVLDLPHLFEKVIIKKRGGYCFELNTLYAAFLKSLGFAPKPVLGRVWLSNPLKTPPRNHLAHLVELEGKTYITDVGFGGFMTRVPLDINDPAPIEDNVGMVRVIQIADQQFMIQRKMEKGWTNQYSFENVEISEEDIHISNYYMSTHPNSIFYTHRCIGKNTSDGRLGLFNNKISIRKGIKVVDKIRVELGLDWLEVIKKEFSLHLDFSKEELSILLKK